MQGECVCPLNYEGEHCEKGNLLNVKPKYHYTNYPRIFWCIAYGHCWETVCEHQMFDQAVILFGEIRCCSSLPCVISSFGMEGV